MSDEPPRELLADTTTLRLYALRESFTLFELAALVHGCSPEAIARRAHADIAAYRRETLDNAEPPPMPAEVLTLVEAMPERMLGGSVGATLAALKLATGANTIRKALERADARRLIERLGYSLPHELGAVETPRDRAVRRLARFRALGGELRPAGTGWQITGRRGALTALASEESAAGRPQAARQDVTRDLRAAAQAQMRC